MKLQISKKDSYGDTLLELDILYELVFDLGFPDALVVKNPPTNVGDAGLTPGFGRFPGGGHGNPLYYSCLENSMDRGAWQATIHGVAKSQT